MYTFLRTGSMPACSRRPADGMMAATRWSMRRTRLLCAIGVSVWSAVAAGNQAAPPMALSAALRAHVKDARFGIVTSIRGLPLGVRDGLQTLFGSQALDIAEPGAKFQVTDVIVDPNLPIRRLVAAGCSTELLPRLLRARRHRPHVARGDVSLDACRDTIRVGRYRARRPGDNRRRSEGHPVRRDQGPDQVLVIRYHDRPGHMCSRYAARTA